MNNTTTEDMGPTAQPQRAPPKADLVMVFPYKVNGNKHM